VAADGPAAIRHDDPLLRLVADSPVLEFEAERSVIDRLAIPGTQRPVNRDSATDDEVSDFFLSRRNWAGNLKATGLRLGYVMNFNVEVLKNGTKRVVL
jgi:hypothetical protein